MIKTWDWSFVKRTFICFQISALRLWIVVLVLLRASRIKHRNDRWSSITAGKSRGSQTIPTDFLDIGNTDKLWLIHIWFELTNSAGLLLFIGPTKKLVKQRIFRFWQSFDKVVLPSNLWDDLFGKHFQAKNKPLRTDELSTLQKFFFPRAFDSNGNNVKHRLIEFWIFWIFSLGGVDSC